MPFQEIHLTDLTEYLADSFLKYNSNFEVEFKDCSLDGYLKINTLKSSLKFTNENIDFDLSGCECSGLDDMNYSDFLNKAIYTASPYEFAEFLINKLGYVKFLICLMDGCWVIQILDYKELNL
ncbi:MAG: hypothetical protein ACR2NW_02250 [Thermodesulfobacteriota bacterium]